MRNRHLIRSLAGLLILALTTLAGCVVLPPGHGHGHGRHYAPAPWAYHHHNGYGR